MVAVYILASVVASHHSATTRRELAALPRLTLGALPPPLAGEGWGGGELARMSLVACPLPVPPPQAGEGMEKARPLLAVLAGLDPAIHPLRKKFLRRTMDPRVKPAGDASELVLAYPRGRAMGTSAKILYCCTRGLAASAASTNCSELLPMSARGRIITRMKRLGRSAACANTGSGPLSYHAPPGPYEVERPAVSMRMPPSIRQRMPGP